MLPALLALAAISGCATKPAPSDPEAVAEYNETNDPLEPTNRVFYRVNDALDSAVLRPVAVVYRDGVPEPVRTATHNILANLSDPVVLANDMMQGKPRRAGDTLMRFVLNSTVGVVGIFDVATGLGWPSHDNDFGLTLAVWGTEDGPFLYLPVLGPSNPRDVTGFGGDIVLDPFTWVGQGAVVDALGYTRYAVSAVDTRAGLIEPIDEVKRSALDPYATFRSLYRQHRQSQIEEIRNDTRASVPAWYPQPTSAPQ